MPSYDKAITIFAPDGNLFQVQYAFEAVNKGSCTMAVKGRDCVVLAVEKKSVAKLQDPRTIRKIMQVDDHIWLTFSGLQADARILVDKARLECQSYRFNMEDAPSVAYIAKFVASEQQKYTQKGGVRPFGISTYIIGMDDISGVPRLFQTEPSGTISEWKAGVMGRSAKTVKAAMEKSYPETAEEIAALDETKTVKFAVESIMECVESGKNMEVAVMTKDSKVRFLEPAEIEAHITQINKEKEEAEAAKGKK